MESKFYCFPLQTLQPQVFIRQRENTGPTDSTSANAFWIRNILKPPPLRIIKANVQLDLCVVGWGQSEQEAGKKETLKDRHK